MQTTRIRWLVGLVSVFSFLLPGWGGRARGGQTVSQSSTLARYIQAIQKRDVKTIIDLSGFYQQHVADIKAQNPRALWPKLIGEYYESTIPRFTAEPSGGASFAEMSFGMMGDPAQGIRAALVLLPSSCKWAISETRPGPQADSVYVTVEYPEIKDAPVVGSQILRHTILQFMVDRPTGLVGPMQKVTQADAYWTGGPNVRTAMASRFYAVGLWDQAISQLEPLVSQNELSTERQDLLASAYSQRASHECFATATNVNVPGHPKFQQFGNNPQCLPDIRRAVSLKPSLAKGWANQLLTSSNESLQAGALESASSLLKMAPEFVAGDQQLEAKAGKLRLEVAARYLHLALYNFAHQGNGDSVFVQRDIRNAQELSPDLLRSEVALEVLGQCLREAADGKAHGDGFADMYFFGILSFMKKYGIAIPSNKSTEFLEWADQTKSPAQWRKAVAELTSAGFATTASAAQTGTMGPSRSSIGQPPAPQPAPVGANAGNQRAESSAGGGRGDTTARNPLLQQAEGLDRQAQDAATKAQELEQKVQGSSSQGIGGILRLKYSVQAKRWRTKEKEYREQAQHLRQEASKSQQSSAASPSATAQPASSPQPSGGCGGAVDLGYSITADGHPYRAKSATSVDGGQIPIFFDEKGSAVQDGLLLHRLELGAWTRENIVASPATRSEIANKERVLSDIIGTSQALQRYEAVQDLLARGMAEAIEGAVTGGISLSKAVPKLLWGTVRSQLLNSPRTLFTLSAQVALQNARDYYGQLQDRNVLPPADSTALEITALENVKSLYEKAQALDLPNEALASALMPKSGLELTNQALQSVVSELIPGLPSANESVTLDGLWKLQKSLAEAGKGQPALQKYSENFNLVANLSAANNRKIDAWATQAGELCSGAPRASGGSPADIAGAYADPEDPTNVWLYLKSDGTFVEGTPDGAFGGTYRTENDKVAFQTQGGQPFQLGIKQDGLRQLDFPRVYVKMAYLPEAIAAKQVQPMGKPSARSGDRSSLETNERIAVGCLWTISVAETIYSTEGSYFTATLKQLGGLVDASLASGIRSGYRIVYSPGPRGPRGIESYSVHADPVSPGVTGREHYYMDSAGGVRHNRERQAGPTDEELRVPPFL
jgi:hypothetical protein